MKLVGALIALAAIANASPIKSRSPYAVKETHYVPQGWTQYERDSEDKFFSLNIGLKQGDFKALEKALYEGELPDAPATLPYLSHNTDQCSLGS